MKTALFITIGTRDVSIRKEIEHKAELVDKIALFQQKDRDAWLSSPRKGGKVIIDNFADYESFVDYPIIRPAIEEITEMGESGQLDFIYLIYTDQSRAKTEVEEKFLAKDSIYLAQIIEKKIRSEFGNKVKKVKKIPISDDVAFYDNMYNFFSQKFNADHSIQELIKENAVVYVMPQGGIASINTTLLLKCAEYFNNITQLSKPEGFAVPVSSMFPQLFKRNLTKERIKQAIESFDYSIISAYNFSPFINTLSQYAFRRSTFNFTQARKTLFRFRGMEEKQLISDLTGETKQLENNQNLRFKEWYLICKICLHQKKYSDFLLKMFNLSENILKPFAEEKLGEVILFNSSNRHKKWTELVDKQDSALKVFLSTYKVSSGNTLRLSSPSRYAYKAIFDFYAEETKKLNYEQQIHHKLERLTELRNQAGHKLVGISKDDLEAALGEVDSSIADMIACMDAYFELDDFGCYEGINTTILRYLV